jgi:hypothetical protein
MRSYSVIIVAALLLLLLSEPVMAKKKKNKKSKEAKKKALNPDLEEKMAKYVNNEDSILFAAKDEALPESIFKNLLEECRSVGSWSGEEDSMMYGKKPTFWLDLQDDPEPRSYIEKALLHLRKEVVPRMFAHRKEQTIIGGEWWVQVRDGSETIGFHYDKDEAMASLQGIMKMPLVSTVTYLTDVGAPTLILNQTTIDGNMEVPEVPEEGYLSYPKKNRHIMFSGDLQHGVMGSAAPESSGSIQQGRVTLLINWWDVAPLEPNTRVLTDETAASIGLDKLMHWADHGDDEDDEDDDEDDEDDEDSDVMEVEVTDTGDTLLKAVGGKGKHSTQAAAADLLSIPTTLSDATRHQITLPPGDLFFAYLPKKLDGGLHRIRWNWNETFGGVGLLDLESSTQVGQLFRLPEPKVMVIYNKKDKKTYKKMLNSVLPIAKTYLGSVKFYFCSSDKTADMLSAFGLTADELPRIAVHDTKTDEKWVQPKEEFSTKPEDIEAFIKQHIDLEGREFLHK